MIALALAFLLLLNVRLHRPGGTRAVQAHLRYLEGALGEGAAEEMQELFPEGYVFTWPLYGLASARTAGRLAPGDARREHLLTETRRALAAVRSETGRSIFVADMDPPYGVFHAPCSAVCSSGGDSESSGREAGAGSGWRISPCGAQDITSKTRDAFRTFHPAGERSTSRTRRRGGTERSWRALRVSA